MKPLNYSLLNQKGVVVLTPYTSDNPRPSFVSRPRPIFADKDTNDYINEKLLKAHEKLDKKLKEDEKASN